MTVVASPRVTTEEEIFTHWVQTEDVKSLCLFLFQFDITPTQEKIIAGIAFQKEKRLLISAFTRYGKSQCVALGVVLYILFNRNKKVLIVAPNKEKTKIIRNYIAQAITKCPYAVSILDISVSGADRLRKEVSKGRMTFKNDCEVMTLSADLNKDGQGLMGFGGDLVICDELAEVSREAFAKLFRTLGDNPEDSIFIGLFNPWSKGSIAYKLWKDQTYTNIHVDYNVGLAEGRITQSFVEEQRRNLLDWQFQVLYESVFPDEFDNSLFNYRDLEVASENKWMPEEDKNYEISLGIDIATYGIDLTVMLAVYKDLEAQTYHVHPDVRMYSKQSTVETTQRIIDMVKDFSPDHVNVDNGNAGVAVIDMLEVRGIDVMRVNFGGKATNKLMLNLKADMYYTVAQHFQKKIITIPQLQILIDELSSMAYEKMENSNKTKIIDPEKSPDYADALVIAFAHEVSGQSFDILDDFIF